MQQKSAPQRLLWAQFDALQMGSGWDEEDIKKPQIMLEDVFGDSHPGSTHLAGLMEQAKYARTSSSTTIFQHCQRSSIPGMIRSRASCDESSERRSHTKMF